MDSSPGPWSVSALNSGAMDFFEAVERRRSIRKYTSNPVPEEVLRKAFAAAILAPNSSNSQTWDFYWVRSSENKTALIKSCLNQSAARTAAELIVVVASPAAWRRSWPELKSYAERIHAPRTVKLYYSRLFPSMYRWGFLNSLGFVKGVAFYLTGLFRPMMRGPFSRRDIQEVCIKSAALAAENFVLAISAQGFASCMMEGFDECRVSRILKLRFSDRVVMVIAVGEEGERGTWGPRFRLPLNDVVHEV
jgi:nitroreductase